mmetsp:Transcript_20388/g.59572  ORF Transcript_20388/g.59572 Transcript_20388/m.59572 type:complete len:386 (-) Transcript_20388:315-1472(-)
MDELMLAGILFNEAPGNKENWSGSRRGSGMPSSLEGLLPLDDGGYPMHGNSAAVIGPPPVPGLGMSSGPAHPHEAYFPSSSHPGPLGPTSVQLSAPPPLPQQVQPPPSLQLGKRQREPSSAGPALGVGSSTGVASAPAATKKSSTGRSRTKKTPEQQRADRRERNRRHARCSRARKKLLIDALQNCIKSLQEENAEMKRHIHERFGDEGLAKLLASHGAKFPATVHDQLIAADPSQATALLDSPDFALVRALKTGKQNFVITDPRLPDNPIVYVSQGFMDLTGYNLEEVLGRNCRFMQGPDTDSAEVAKMRKAIEAGKDVSICLLNYRKDRSTFWNQVFCCALRTRDGSISNYVGVQCELSNELVEAAQRKGSGDDDQSNSEDEA